MKSKKRLPRRAASKARASSSTVQPPTRRSRTRASSSKQTKKRDSDSEYAPDSETSASTSSADSNRAADLRKPLTRRSNQNKSRSQRRSYQRRRRKPKRSSDEEFVPSNTASSEEESAESYVPSEGDSAESYVPSEDEGSSRGSAADVSSNGSAEQEWKEPKFKKSARAGRKRPRKSSVAHKCSGEDAITLEPLGEQRHLYWSVNAGDECQCYSFTTLYKIALREGGWKEPPIFREPASSEIRVGMDAAFGADKIRGCNFHDSDAEDEAFELQFSRYRSRLLPRSRLYVCPLCYECVRSGLENEDGEGEDEEVSGDINHDPLEVLGMDGFCELDDSDEEEYVSNARELVAAGSALCFKRVSTLLAHMQQFHGIEGANKRDYRPIIQRYRLRGGDGLVPRYWHRTGDPRRMHSYWTADRVVFLLSIHKFLEEGGDAAGNTFEIDKEVSAQNSAGQCNMASNARGFAEVQGNLARVDKCN